jgi:hypothetical protein
MAFPPAFDVAAAVADAVAAISEHSRVIREISCHKYGVASCKSHEKRRHQCTSAFGSTTLLDSKISGYPGRVPIEVSEVHRMYPAKRPSLRRVAIYAVRNTFGDPLFPFDDVCVSFPAPQLQDIPLVELKVRFRRWFSCERC